MFDGWNLAGKRPLDGFKRTDFRAGSSIQVQI